MSDAPGIDAVMEAFAREYGAAPRLDFRTPLPPELDPHPAKLVTAWAGPGYWHLVTCGLTELFKKFSNIPDQSGWGVELTMKVPRGEGDEGPPEYAVELLRFLVKYVYSSRKRFSRGHYIQLSPFEEDSTLVGATFVLDTRLTEAVKGPFGDFYFLQVVGVTWDELDALARVDDDRVTKALARRSPHLLTEPSRPSVFEGPDAPPFPSEPAVASGSLQVDVLRVSRSFTGDMEVELDQRLAPQVARLMVERLGQGHPLQLNSGSTRLLLRPEPRSGWSQVEDLLTVDLTPEAMAELRAGLGAAEANAPIQVSELSGLTFRCVER